MSVEDWKRHNEAFRYEPPEDPPELWGAEDYEELYDRVIRREVNWICQICTQPISGGLKGARRHVENHHSQKLLEKHTEEQIE